MGVSELTLHIDSIMGVQKSQKGRNSAAQELHEVTRRKSGVSERLRQGRQQFGGVAQRVDRDVDRLSGRTKRAIKGAGH